MHVARDSSSVRDLLRHLYRVAVEAAHGANVLVANTSVDGDVWRYTGGDPLSVPLPAKSSRGRVLVVGAGKAAAAMARGMEHVLQERVSDGVVVVKYGHRDSLGHIRTFEAGHPIPDEAGVAATQELVRLLDTVTPADTVFCMLSGGASSLLVAPALGVSLRDKAITTKLLVNSGASIQEINGVRKQLSTVKGGRLRQKQCRAFCTLAISDVVGDDPSVIGSGPTVQDASPGEDALQVIDRYCLRSALPAAVLSHFLRGRGAQCRRLQSSEHDTFRIIASNRASIDACVREASKLGLPLRVVSYRMTGNTHDAARSFSESVREVSRGVRAGAAPTLLIAGGETTLTVEGTGRGGRNQEFALIAAQALQDVSHVAVLVAGTDGTDGPTDAAGAFVDESTFTRARALGLEPLEHLRRNDAYPLFEALGDLHRTGPTGTNVMDLVIGFIY
jgi:glycerate 2-kinase